MAFDIKSMGFKKAVRKLRKLDLSIDEQAIMVEAGENLVTMMKPRIRSGIRADGGKMRPYSQTPMYVSKGQRGIASELKGKPPRGKPPKHNTKFKNGKKHKSIYLERGYAELRRLLGRGEHKNRLVLTGKMLTNMSVSPYSKNAAKLKFPRKQENIKASANQIKFGFLWSTKDERKKTKAFVGKEINKAIKQAVR